MAESTARLPDGPQGEPARRGWRRAYIGLGANLGEPLATLASACSAMAAWPDCRWVAVSLPYRSAPVDAAGPDFFNAVAAMDTRLDGLRLLRRLQALEQQHGRQRPYQNAPRTLDLDLLLLGDDITQSAELVLPHPRLALRAFVLMPLLELEPGLQAPGLGRLADRLQAVAGQSIERLAAWPGGADAYNLSA